MNQECQDVADQQTFAEGDPQHLVLTQTKALSDPLDGRLMPQHDEAGLLRLLWLLGFLAHPSILPSTSLRCPAQLLSLGGHPELAPLHLFAPTRGIERDHRRELAIKKPSQTLGFS